MRQALHAYLILLVAFSVTAGAPDQSSGDELDINLGPQQTVFPDGYRGMHYFPDLPIVVLETRPWVWLLVDTNKTVLMEGPALGKSVPRRIVLSAGANGKFDSDYAGISGVYRDQQKQELIALYHGERHSRGKRGEKRRDWAIGLAISKDGKTFHKMGKVITCSTPRRASGNRQHGVGDPSLCGDASGKWLYCYYSDLSKLGGRPNTICMARCNISKPGKWRKYRNGQFDSSGLGGKDSPVVPHPIPRSDVSTPNVQYMENLSKYVMTLFVLSHAEFKSDEHPKVSGFYIRASAHFR